MSSPPYSEWLRDPRPGDEISAEQAKLQNDMLRRAVVLPNSITDSSGTRMVSRRTGTPFRIYTCQLTGNLLPGSYANATLLVGTSKATNGGTIKVYDTPQSITTGKKIASGVKCRVFKDHDMDLAVDEYVLLVAFACEVDQ